TTLTSGRSTARSSGLTTPFVNERAARQDETRSQAPGSSIARVSRPLKPAGSGASMGEKGDRAKAAHPGRHSGQSGRGDRLPGQHSRPEWSRLGAGSSQGEEHETPARVGG